MCSTCGCGLPDAPPGDAKAHAHDHAHGHDHGHADGHDHAHGHGHDHGIAGRVVEVGQALLAENDRFASYNQGYFDGRRIRCLNMISAPGSGKTTLLEKSLVALKDRGARCSVIEGDQTTELDAQRIARTGARVHQIQTGRSCHLDAHQVQHAVEHLRPEDDSILFIENVGNLICPTEFQLGEHERVTLLSVTEGADKPAKYPLAFSTATAVVIGKIDLLPHVDFDVAEVRRLVQGLNPGAPIFELSAKTGDGMGAWLDWVLGTGA